MDVIKNGQKGFMSIPCKMVNTDKKLAPPKQGSIIIGRGKK